MNRDNLTFKESVIKDPELGQGAWNDWSAKAANNPFYKKALQEGLYSDVAGAVGAVQGIVWKAAVPALISRQIIKTLPTKNALEKVPRDIIGEAVEGEGPAPDTGDTADFVTITVNSELKIKKTWSQSYLEDASWDVLAWQTGGCGVAIAKKEMQKVVALYNAIAAANLASGAELTVTSGAPTWAQIIALISAVQKEDFGDNIVVAMSATNFGGLMLLDQFIHGLYLDHSDVNLPKGVVYHETLGVTFVRSSLVTKTLAIDVDNAALQIVRRDLTAKPYETPERYGVFASERIGMGIIRSKAVARGTT